MNKLKIKKMSEIFDAFFKEVNDSERQKLIDKQNCFLILKGNDLCLRYNMGYNSSANITVPLKLELYSLLKSLCHVLTTRKVFDVLGDREKLNAACRGLADEQLKNQVVYKLCTLIQYGECESLSLKPVILEAMKMAADLYETELHDVTQFFKSRVSDEDWCNLFVIVLGKASPRKGHVALQYFEHLVGDIDIGAKSTNPRKRNRKLCYVENIDDIDTAIKEAAQIVLERQTYSSFMSMEQDILANDAKTYLNKHCTK